MISLFRKTRRWLLNRNKFGKYLVYAMGEVFLIVLGILIALGINNWNERRLAKERELFYLTGLKEEFSQNRIKLENLIRVNRLNFEGAKKLVGFMNDPGSRPNEKELSELLFNSFSYEINYNPNNSLVYELINSGRLKDISNPGLRRSLTSWESFIQSVNRQESSLREQRERMVDIFRKDENSIRTIFDETGITTNEMGLEKGKEFYSNFPVLNSREFENNLLIYIATGISTETSHYQPLLKEIDAILLKIDSEIEKKA